MLPTQEVDPAPNQEPFSPPIQEEVVSVKICGTLNIADKVSLVAFLAGFIGALSHGIISSIPNATPIIKNQYPAVWFTSFLMASAIQLFYTSRNSSRIAASRISLFFNYCYFGYAVITSFIFFISYCIIGDVASSIWTVLLICLNSFTIYVLYSRKETAFEPRNHTCCIVSGLNVAFKIILVILMFVLAAGGIITASAYQYKAPGNILSVTLTDGRTSGLHVYCQGPKNVSRPVIWMIADAAHGVVDFYGIQYYLSNQGRRVCSFDNAGFAWSYDIISNGANANLYLDGVINASGEGLPVIFVANGGGGSVVLEYQTNHPKKVAAIVFVAVYPAGIEFDFYQNQSNPVISDNAKYAYRAQELSSRTSLVNIILGLAIPWGLMPLFNPISSVSSGYYPPEKRAEYKVQSWKSNLWINQAAGLQLISSTPDSQDPLNTVVLPPNVPFYHVLCQLNSTQACSPARTGYSSQLTGSDCQPFATQNDYYYHRQILMTNRIQPVSNVTNTTFVFNTDTACQIDMPLSYPSYTATQVLNLVSWITL